MAGSIIGLKGPMEQEKKATSKTGKQQTKVTTTKKPKACMHKCINANTKNEAKTPQKKENKHGKTRNARQALTQAKANVRQRQESKQSEKTAKQHSKKPRAKNSNKNKTTICVHKSAKKAQTTQGKRHTPDFIAINPKTPAHQTASAQKGDTGPCGFI